MQHFDHGEQQRAGQRNAQPAQLGEAGGGLLLPVQGAMPKQDAHTGQQIEEHIEEDRRLQQLGIQGAWILRIVQDGALDRFRLQAVGGHDHAEHAEHRREVQGRRCAQTESFDGQRAGIEIEQRSRGQAEAVAEKRKARILRGHAARDIQEVRQRCGQGEQEPGQQPRTELARPGAGQAETGDHHEREEGQYQACGDQ